MASQHAGKIEMGSEVVSVGVKLQVEKSVMAIQINSSTEVQFVLVGADDALSAITNEEGNIGGEGKITVDGNFGCDITAAESPYSYALAQSQWVTTEVPL